MNFGNFFCSVWGKPGDEPRSFAIRRRPKSERILEGLLVALESVFTNDGAQLDHPLTLSAETMELLARKLREYSGEKDGDGVIEEALRLAQTCQSAEGHEEWMEEEEDKQHVAKTLQGLKQYFKVISSLKIVERDRHLSHVCDLSPFPSLQTLDIEGCSPSFLPTLFDFRGQLKFLRIQRAALMSLEELLGPGRLPAIESNRDRSNEDGGEGGGRSGRMRRESITLAADSELGAWRKLEHLSVNHCDLAELGGEGDNSLARLPHLFYLEVQHNALTTLGPLDPLYSLRYLDASFNSIRSLSQTHSWSSHLTVLVLHRNELKTLRGIEALTSLRHVNVSNNRIKRWSEVQRLSQLPRLEVLSLTGNPITSEPLYRICVYQIFNLPSRGSLALVLDGEHASEKEKREVQQRGFFVLPMEGPTSSSTHSSVEERRRSWSDASAVAGVGSTTTPTPSTTSTSGSGGAAHHRPTRSQGFGEVSARRDVSATTLFPPAVEGVVEEAGQERMSNSEGGGGTRPATPTRWSFGYLSPWSFGAPGDTRASPAVKPLDNTIQDPHVQTVPNPRPQLSPPRPSASSTPQVPSSIPVATTKVSPPPKISQQPEVENKEKEGGSSSGFQLWRPFRSSARSTPVDGYYPSPLTLTLPPVPPLLDTPSVSTPVDEEVEELAPLPHPFTPPSSVAGIAASPSISIEGSVATSRDLASEDAEEEWGMRANGGGSRRSSTSSFKRRRRRRRAEIEEEELEGAGDSNGIGPFANGYYGGTVSVGEYRAKSASPYLSRNGRSRKSPGLGKKNGRRPNSTSPQSMGPSPLSNEDDRLRVINPAPPLSEVAMAATPVPVKAVEDCGADQASMEEEAMAGTVVVQAEPTTSSSLPAHKESPIEQIKGTSDKDLIGEPPRQLSLPPSVEQGIAPLDDMRDTGIPPSTEEALDVEEEEEEDPEVAHLEALINKMRFEITRMESVGLQKFIAPMQLSIAQLEARLVAARALEAAKKKLKRKASPRPAPTSIQQDDSLSSSHAPSNEPSSVSSTATIHTSTDLTRLTSPPPPAPPLPQLHVAPKNFKGDRFSRRPAGVTSARMSRLGSPDGTSRRSPQSTKDATQEQKGETLATSGAASPPVANDTAKESIPVTTTSSPSPMVTKQEGSISPPITSTTTTEPTIISADKSAQTSSRSSSPAPVAIAREVVGDTKNGEDASPGRATMDDRPVSQSTAVDPPSPGSPTVVTPVTSSNHGENPEAASKDGSNNETRARRGFSSPMPASPAIAGSDASAFSQHKKLGRRSSFSGIPSAGMAAESQVSAMGGTTPPPTNSSDHDERRSSISSNDGSVSALPLGEPFVPNPYIGAARYAFTEVTLDMEVLRTYFSEQVFGNGGNLGAFQVTSQSRCDSLDFHQVENLLYLYRTSLVSDWREVSEDGRPRPDGNYHDILVVETVALVAVTNLYIYFLDDGFAKQGKLFRDAPRPIIFGRHLLRNLARVVIGFMGQTLRLEFQPTETMSLSRRSMAATTLQRGRMESWSVHGYTLITRDKKATYDLLQDVRRLANEKRVTSQRPLEKTEIANMEQERLELMDSEDVLYYQLMFQWWKSQPGVLQPRTVFVTSDRLQIFIEDFRQGGPRPIDPSQKPRRASKFSAMPTEGERVTSILNTSLRDVVSVEEENDPRYITITVKDPGLFSWSQTWRLFSENRKHIDGLRRILWSRVDEASSMSGEAVHHRPSTSSEHQPVV